MVNRWVVHVASGEFIAGGYTDPTPPILAVDEDGVITYDPAYGVVTLPDERLPDPRTEKWNGAAAVAKSNGEVEIYDQQVDAQQLDDDTLGVTIGALVDLLKLSKPQVEAQFRKQVRERRHAKPPKEKTV